MPTRPQTGHLLSKLGVRIVVKCGFVEVDKTPIPPHYEGIVMTESSRDTTGILVVFRKLCLLLAVTAVALVGVSIVLYSQGFLMMWGMLFLIMVLGLAVSACLRMWYLLRQAATNNERRPCTDATPGAEH